MELKFEVEKTDFLKVLNIGTYEGMTKKALEDDDFSGAEFVDMQVLFNGEKVKELLLVVYAEHDDFLERVINHYNAMEDRKLHRGHAVFYYMTKKDFIQTFTTVPNMVARVIDDCDDNTAGCRLYTYKGE